MHQLTPGSCPKADGIQNSTFLPPWGKKKQDSGEMKELDLVIAGAVCMPR
jgi:hypothetical protein